MEIHQEEQVFILMKIICKILKEVVYLQIMKKKLLIIKIIIKICIKLLLIGSNSQIQTLLIMIFQFQKLPNIWKMKM